MTDLSLGATIRSTLSKRNARESNRSRRFTELVREKRRASRVSRPELRPEAVASVAEFERHTRALNQLVDAEIETLVVPPGPLFDVGSLGDGSRLHVFGPSNFDAQTWDLMPSGFPLVLGDAPLGGFPIEALRQVLGHLVDDRGPTRVDRGATCGVPNSTKGEFPQ